MQDAGRMRELFEESLPLFNALGDPIRQQLIMLMMEGERKSVAESAATMELPRPTVSHHLKVLKDAHILGEQKVGTKIYYCPQMGEYFRPVKELVDMVAVIESKKERIAHTSAVRDETWVPEWGVYDNMSNEDTQRFARNVPYEQAVNEGGIWGDFCIN